MGPFAYLKIRSRMTMRRPRLLMVRQAHGQALLLLCTLTCALKIGSNRDVEPLEDYYYGAGGRSDRRALRYVGGLVPATAPGEYKEKRALNFIKANVHFSPHVY